MKTIRFCIACLALSAALYVPSAHGEPAKADAAKADSAKKGKDGKKELVASSGLYLGKIVEVDENRRYIFVKPLNGNGPRKTFYLDHFTLVRQDRKPAKWDLVEGGAKVGVRYIREQDIAVAEGIFIIGDEINARDFEMPKKKPKVEPKKEEAKEGESKPAAGKPPAKH